ncbi:hypothetical protein G6F56_011547 [Rhizopus delemar]|nr:hypothetical protein G6F56_011547 [Rhizopus delemar]
MSPFVVNPTEEFSDSDLDMQTWLKEIEGAENLMTEVETKADVLQTKIDALLEEVSKKPTNQEEQDK